MCDLTQVYFVTHMWHDSFFLFLIRDMTHHSYLTWLSRWCSYVTWLTHTWHDSCMTVPPRATCYWQTHTHTQAHIHTHRHTQTPICDMPICDMTHLWHDSYVTWLICDMTHMWHDSYVTWLICDMTHEYATWLMYESAIKGHPLLTDTHTHTHTYTHRERDAHTRTHNTVPSKATRYWHTHTNTHSYTHTHTHTHTHTQCHQGPPFVGPANTRHECYSGQTWYVKSHINTSRTSHVSCWTREYSHKMPF